MKKLFLVLAILFLLFVPRMASAAIYSLGSPVNAGSASSITTAYPSSPAAVTGLAAILIIRSQDATFSSITSGWTQVDSLGANPNTLFFRHCYTSGDANPTVTWTAGTSGSRGIIFMEDDTNCQDSVSNNPVDQHHIISGGNTTFSSTALTPSSPNESYHIFGALCALTASAPAPFWTTYNDSTNALFDTTIMTTGSSATPVSTFTVGACNGGFDEILFTPASHPKYEAVRGVTGATGAASLNVAYPPVQANDSIVVHVMNPSAATATITGFTVIRNSDQWTGTPGHATITTLCKTATGSESGNFSVASTSGSPTLVAAAMSIVASQCTPDSQNGNVNTGTGQNPWTLANVTPTVVKDLLTGVAVSWAQFGQAPNLPFIGGQGNGSSPQPFTIIGTEPAYPSTSATAMVANANGADQWLTSSFAWLNTRPASTPKNGLIVIGQ